VVVCSQSDVLHTACTGHFKVGIHNTDSDEQGLIGLQEASAGVYEFLHDSRLVIEKLISFFYTANYDDKVDLSESEPSRSVSNLQLYAQVFALADKYHVHGLSALCIRKYKYRLKSICDPVEFLKSIPDVYALTTPVRALRDVVSNFARMQIARFLRERSAQAAYKNAVRAAPEFAIDLLSL
jgi:hypothetical protein